MGDFVFLPGPILTGDEYDSDGSDVSTGSCCCSDCHDPCEGFGSKASRWVLGCGGRKTKRCCYRDEGNCPRDMCCYEEWHESKRSRGRCDDQRRRGCGKRECRDACVRVNNVIYYDCVCDNAYHQQAKSCKCQKTSERTWWGRKPARKRTKPRKKGRRAIEYDYDYGQADRRCTCGEEHSNSEDESEETEWSPRVVRSVRKAKRKDGTKEPRKTKKRYTQINTRRKSSPQLVETEGDESDNSLRCQVSYNDVETECEEESPGQELKDTLNDAAGWSRTLSKEDSEELGEQVKESNTSREFCKQSRHSV